MRYFIASFLSVALIGVCLSGCLFSLPESFLFSQSSSQPRASASSSQYINEMCWMYEDYYSCFADTLDKARNYEDWKDRLFFHCTTAKENKEKQRNLLKEASRSLSSYELSKLEDFFKEVDYSFDEGDINDCKDKRSKDRRVDCLEKVTNRFLRAIGCK